jgi:hypothetical protein
MKTGLENAARRESAREVTCTTSAQIAPGLIPFVELPTILVGLWAGGLLLFALILWVIERAVR